MKASNTIKVLFSSLSVAIGLILLLLPAAQNGLADKFCSNLGLALIVAGIVSLFQTFALETFDRSELTESISSHVGITFKDKIDHLQASLQTQFSHLQTTLQTTSGLILVCAQRRAYPGYYDWIDSNDRQTISFAGRSVLHRIDDHCTRQRQLDKGAADAIIRRVRHGASFRIIFFDPRSPLLRTLAEDETKAAVDPKHNLAEFARNLSISLDVCQRIYDELKSENTRMDIDVKVSAKIPYFAYHKVDSRTIVGFYFSQFMGDASPAYSVSDSQTQEFFDDHFQDIFGHATPLLSTRNGGTKLHLDDEVFLELRAALAHHLRPT